jgi:hypothetical protein
LPGPNRAERGRERLPVPRTGEAPPGEPAQALSLAPSTAVTRAILGFHTVSRPRREVLREVDRELHALAERAPSWRKARPSAADAPAPPVLAVAELSSG